MANDTELTIFQHLDELRSRLLKAIIALVVATAACVVFTPQALELLINLSGDRVQAINPTEPIMVYFRIALIGGVTLAMPVIVYQIVRFALPGLLPHERKYLYFLLPGATICFAGGVAFAAFVMLPVTVQFLQNFLQTIVDNRWTLDNYISFVTRMLFWMGVVFQMPLVMFFLAKLNLVTAQKLSRFRKYAVLVLAVVAAIVTPTTDPVTMMIVMVPLYVLYEVGIQLAKIAAIGRPPEEQEAGAAT